MNNLVIGLICVLSVQCFCKNQDTSKGHKQTDNQESTEESPNKLAAEQVARQAALHQAIIDDNPDKLKTLLDQGVDVNMPGPNGYAPLHDVVRLANDAQMVQALVAKGANINIGNKEGETPLMLAIKTQNIKSIQALLAMDKTDLDGKDIHGKTALHHAVETGNMDIMRPLLLAGDADLNMNIQAGDGETPLMLAAGRFDKEMLAALLEKGASVEIVDQKGNNLLHKLLELHQPELVKMVLEKVPLDMRKKLLNTKNQDGDTPFRQVFDNYNKELIQFCLDQGADITLAIKHATLPNGKWEDIIAKENMFKEDVEENIYAQMKLLEHQGMDKNQEELVKPQNITPITDEMIRRVQPTGYQVLAPLLLALKASKPGEVRTDIINEYGYQGEVTALHQACYLGDIDVIKVLIERGADPNLKTKTENRDQGTALHSAIRGGNRQHIIKYLLENGAKLSINTKNRDGNTPLLLAVQEQSMESVEDLLQDNSIDLDLKDNVGRTALWHASWLGNLEIVKKLVKAGAGLNVTEENGYSPLVVAVACRHQAVVEFLLKNNAQLDLQDKDGNNSLHESIFKRYKEITPLLLNKADELGMTMRLLNTKNKEGKTPLTAALMNFDKELVRQLLQKGADLTMAMEGILSKDRDAVNSLLRHINVH